MYDKFSQVYEAKIKEDFSYAQMAEFIRAQVRAAGLKAASVLDLGCGTGNASVELVKDFARIVLCDPSADMLAFAREKFRPPFLPVFLQAKAQSVRLPGRFDLIYSVLDVWNYLTMDEVSQSLAACYGNLKASGLVVFDISSESKLREMGRTGIYLYDDEDYFHAWENTLKADHLELTLNLFVRAGNGKPGNELYERITEEQIMYLHPDAQMKERIREAGFRLKGCYDGYSDRPAHDRSARLVYVLEKET